MTLCTYHIREGGQVSLPLTPDVLRGAYAFLCTTEPFRRWNLPDEHDVRFLVSRDRETMGWYTADPHVIAVSSWFVGHSYTLLSIMAHEMIHLHQRETKMDNAAQHNAVFRKLAIKVCKIHGFDPKLF